MRKLVIIEGPDNVGKTYFLKKYFSEYSIISFSTNNAPSNQIREICLKRHNELKEAISHHSIIFSDRSIIGEAIYGYLYRNYDVLNEVIQEVNELKSKTDDLLILTVISTGDIEFLKDKKDADYIWAKKEELVKVSNRFLEVMKYLKGIKRIILNADNYDSYDDLQKDMFYVINSFLNNKPVFKPFINSKLYPYNVRNLYRVCPWQDNCSIFKYQLTLDFKSATSGLGFNKKIMFIGEAPGFKGCGKTGIVFYRDKSGMLLRQALFELGYNLDLDFYTTNLIKCTPPNNQFPNFYVSCQSVVLDEIRENKPEKIICISKKAYDYIKPNFPNLNIIKIPHPAFMFYKYGHNFNKNVKNYIKILKKVLN